MTTALYRWYDASDRLLYVGITARLVDRAGEHARTQPWWAEVARSTVEHYDERAEAEAAEALAIRRERPLHNRKESFADRGSAKAPRPVSDRRPLSPEDLAAIRAVVDDAVRSARRVALSPEEAAELLGVSAPTVRRLLASGRLPYVEVGTGERPLRRIALSALERFVDPDIERGSAA